jgi:hypothetical protein
VIPKLVVPFLNLFIMRFLPSSVYKSPLSVEIFDLSCGFSVVGIVLDSFSFLACKPGLFANLSYELSL